MLESLLKDLGKKETTEVYRGTVSPELLQQYSDGIKKKNEAIEAAKEAWLQTKKECWEKTYAELGLDPDGDYFINPLTGQVMEEVKLEGLDKTEEQC